MKIVKLTGPRGNPMLVNLAHVVTAWPDTDAGDGTRLWMVDGDYIPVRQSLTEILALAN